VLPLAFENTWENVQRWCAACEGDTVMAIEATSVARIVERTRGRMTISFVWNFAANLTQKTGPSSQQGDDFVATESKLPINSVLVQKRHSLKRGSQEDGKTGTFSADSRL
jgi:hypothetical protein